jgi:hypothetical protein
MPCAICTNWIANEDRVYTVELTGDGRDYALFTLSGEVARHVPSQIYEEAVRGTSLAGLAQILQVRQSRIQIHLHVVQIRAEDIRWRLCEANPPPHYIRVTSPSTYSTEHTWYFICESCRHEQPSFEDHTNINVEGSPSTASEDLEEDDQRTL